MENLRSSSLFRFRVALSPFILLFAVGLSSCAHHPAKVEAVDKVAEKPARPAWLAEHTHFATEDWSVYQPTFKPFPATGSPEEAEDFKVLQEKQASRTKADCDQAGLEGHADVESFIAKLPFKISRTDQAKILPFVNKVRSDSDVIIHHFKEQYARPRPPVQFSQLKPCIELPPTGSYPSGHGAIGVILAETLKEFYPKEKKALDKRGVEFGDHRVLGGVHFPSDITMGKLLGLKVLEESKKNPRYGTELAAVKRELKAKR